MSSCRYFVVSDEVERELATEIRSYYEKELARKKKPKATLAQIDEWANQMRECPTPAEAYARQLLKTIGTAFVEQQRIHRYIADFYFPGPRLAVEIDGGVHERRAGYDLLRDKCLLSRFGVSVLRFANEDVTHNPAMFLSCVRTSLNRFQGKA